jgi:hypothetical protein
MRVAKATVALYNSAGSGVKDSAIGRSPSTGAALNQDKRGVVK